MRDTGDPFLVVFAMWGVCTVWKPGHWHKHHPCLSLLCPLSIAYLLAFFPSSLLSFFLPSLPPSFFPLFLRQDFTLYLRLAWISLCSPHCPQICGNLLASFSNLLGLEVCASVPNSCHFLRRKCLQQYLDIYILFTLHLWLHFCKTSPTMCSKVSFYSFLNATGIL